MVGILDAPDISEVVGRSRGLNGSAAHKDSGDALSLSR